MSPDGSGVLREQLQSAIASALRPAPAAPNAAISIPRLQLTLPHGASEAQIAAAVARAVRAAIERGR